MKKIKMYVGMFIVAAFTMTSCQKDSVSETPEAQADFEITKAVSQQNVTTVTHNYEYRGERFSVNYVMDNESGEVLDTQGDIERAEQLFSTDEQASSVLITELEEYNPDAPAETPEAVTINLQLFDTEAEMEAFVEGIDGERIPSTDGEYAANAEGPCNDYDIGGQGRFYFYKNWFFGNEMLPLRRVNRLYYRDYAFGSYNDQMSSLIVLKPSTSISQLRLYEHTCLNGRVLTLHQRRGPIGYGIPSLRIYTLYRWWLFRTSWNDQVSSSQGWVY